MGGVFNCFFLKKNVSILDSLLEKATVWLLDHHGIVVTCNGAIGMTRGMSGFERLVRNTSFFFSNDYCGFYM